MHIFTVYTEEANPVYFDIFMEQNNNYKLYFPHMGLSLKIQKLHFMKQNCEGGEKSNNFPK